MATAQRHTIYPVPMEWGNAPSSGFATPAQKHGRIKLVLQLKDEQLALGVNFKSFIGKFAKYSSKIHATMYKTLNRNCYTCMTIRLCSKYGLLCVLLNERLFLQEGQVLVTYFSRFSIAEQRFRQFLHLNNFNNNKQVYLNSKCF